jgi:hypothetical protein
MHSAPHSGKPARQSFWRGLFSALTGRSVGWVIGASIVLAL